MFNTNLIKEEGDLINKPIFVTADNRLKSSDLLLYQPVSLRRHFWLVSSLKLDIWEITSEAVAVLVSSLVQHTSRR